MDLSRKKAEKCFHCGSEYTTDYSLHWNECAEARKRVYNTPIIPLFSDYPDPATTRQVNREFADLYRRCPHCANMYDGSLSDHEARCNVLGIQRERTPKKDIPLFG
jgi:uncharacterized protein (DUF983 family)